MVVTSPEKLKVIGAAGDEDGFRPNSNSANVATEQAFHRILTSQ